MTKPTTKEIIEHFNLNPLREEGGLFIRTYAANDEFVPDMLSTQYKESRPMGTAILYLLTNHPNSFSALHRLPTDEIYHFYLGDPIELYELHPDSNTTKTIMGHDIFDNQKIQHVVPRNVWQGSRLLPGGDWALLGTTMAPGYADSDFELGKIDLLLEQYSEKGEIIRALLR